MSDRRREITRLSAELAAELGPRVRRRRRPPARPRHLELAPAAPYPTGTRLVSLGGRVEIVRHDPWPTRRFAQEGERLCFAPSGARDGWARADIGVGGVVRRAPIIFGEWEGEGCD